MKFKLTAATGTILSVISLMVPLASAHVVVSPKTAEPAERVTFSMGVPNEKDIAVTEVRVAVPSGLGDVTPTVHPGWTIETTKDGDAVSEIRWTGGEIPSGQRDDFTFRAQLPEKAGEVQWKAYQTYADGTTVSWDQNPSTAGDKESETNGPYSVTTVAEAKPAAQAATTGSSAAATAALGIALVALLLGIFNVVRQRAAR